MIAAAASHDILFAACLFVLVAAAPGAVAHAQTPATAPAPRQRTVAILIFEGVELLDFAGPAEVFIVSEEGRAFRVITVSENPEPVRTMGGVTVKPDFSFKNAPRADILVLPGGDVRNVGAAGIDWIRSAAKDADIVMSVCMGAFLLARAGLLDGIEATTHHWGIKSLKQAAPKCTVVTGKRYVDCGKVITTAGVTAGIDGALHVVERFLGEKAARWAASEWMEHPSEPPAARKEATGNSPHRANATPSP
jgi:transcriptional regulator GlxA family with amidase domain